MNNSNPFPKWFQLSKEEELLKQKRYILDEKVRWASFLGHLIQILKEIRVAPSTFHS